MNSNIFTNLAFAFGFVHACAAQVSDLAQPKLREVVVNNASLLIESQKSPVSLPELTVNPFIGKHAPIVEDNQGSATDIVVAMAESELLARLASQISASGTAVLAGEPILLVGPKRLKVGDVVRLSFESKNYELSIVSISSTSFTVRKGNLTHTRPTRLNQ